MDTVQFLRSMETFRPLPDEELARIATRLKERRFREGQPIFRKGDPGESMYLLLDGRVKALSPDASGQERVLAFLEGGAFFGEMALLTGDDSTLRMFPGAVRPEEGEGVSQEHASRAVARGNAP